MSSLNNRIVRASVDEFKYPHRVDEILTLLHPGDVVTGLNTLSEYSELISRINPSFTYSAYGNPLTICIMGE